MNQEILNLKRKIELGELQINDLFYDEFSFSIISRIYNDLKKYGYYEFNGRFENLIIDFFKQRILSVDEIPNYDSILLTLSNKIKEDTVPNVILFPLNTINPLNLNNNISIADHINLFHMNYKQSEILHDKTDLAKYVSESIYSDFNGQHIMTTKDKAFFNYPIMSILIENLDERVYQEAPKIVEATYSFIRMIDYLKNKSPDDNWFHYPQKEISSTYVVYYNKPDCKKERPFNEGYGHSFRYKFSPLLDIDSMFFDKNTQFLSDYIKQFIDCCFLIEAETSKQDYVNLKKWENAVLLFNTAYEFASIEKYDSMLIILMTILESLFVKNEGKTKSVRLAKSVSLFFAKYKQIKNEGIESLILDCYKYRNKYVHEGIRIESNLSYKPLNDFSGYIRGERPFSKLNNLPIDITTNILFLFELVIETLCSPKVQILDMLEE